MYGLEDNDDTDALSSKEVLARTIYGEASNQPPEGQRAIANVIQNRVKLQGWMGKTFREVCLKPFQFSCWLSGPNRDRLMRATEKEPVYAECLKIASLAINGQLKDITEGATHYKVIGTPAKWAEEKKPVVVLGSHEFYCTI